MPYPDQWNGWAAGHVARLREEAIAVADRLDAALAVQAIVTATTAGRDELHSLSWDDLLRLQSSPIDAADLEAKARRLIGDDPDPQQTTPHEEDPYA